LPNSEVEISKSLKTLRKLNHSTKIKDTLRDITMDSNGMDKIIMGVQDITKTLMEVAMIKTAKPLISSTFS